MTMHSEAEADLATGTFNPSLRWACAELLLAGAIYPGLYPGITAG